MSHLNSEAAYLAELSARRDAAWPAELPREVPLPHGRRSLVDYLAGWAETRPETVAINFYGAEITYGRLDSLARALASALREQGVGPGDRVGLFLPNCPQFTIAFLAILMRGALVVPINPMVRAMELAHYIHDSGARLVIAQDSLAPLLDEIERPEDFRVVTTGLADMLPEAPAFPVPPALSTPPSQSDRVGDLLDWMRRPVDPGAVAPSDWDTLAVINYTGGTTGLPKGCLHSHGDMVFTGACFGAYHLCVGAGAVTLCYIPQFWIAGELSGILHPIVFGSTVVLLNRWDAETVMAAVQLCGVGALALVTDSLVEILDHPRVDDYDLTTLRTTIVASFIKVLNPDYRARWKALTGAVAKEGGYGMTETNTADTFTTGAQVDDYDLRAEPMFVGLPCPQTELKIVDPETGSLKGDGEVGEICIRTPTLMKGYWGRPEASIAAIRGGWYHTGDSGAIGADGYLSFRGRKKEMLKVNGMSVFPAEVEALLARNPAVAACGVVGRPDPVKGEVPVAFVVLADPASSAEAIAAWCHRNMSSFKAPEVRVVPALPMTETGKVKRAVLAERVAAEAAATRSFE